MHFEGLDTEISLSTDLIQIQSYIIRGAMDARTRKSPTTLEINKNAQNPVLNRRKSFPSNYFGVEAFLLLLLLTASLLILPLVLPPLPPPPMLLLLLPIGILVVLLILGFMPYDVRNIATSYL